MSTFSQVGVALLVLLVLAGVAIGLHSKYSKAGARGTLRRFDALLMISWALGTIEKPNKDKHTGNIDHDLENGGFFRVRETTPAERRSHGAKRVAFIRVIYDDGHTGSAIAMIGAGGVILGLGSVVFTSIKLEKGEPSPGHGVSESRNDKIKKELAERIEKLVLISQTSY